MPRYFFDLVHPEGGRETDAEGMEFPSIDEAKQDALHMLGAQALEELKNGSRAEIVIEIRDSAAGPVVCTVSLSAGADC